MHFVNNNIENPQKKENILPHPSVKIAAFIFRKIRTLRHRLGLEYFQFDFVAQSGTLWLCIGLGKARKNTHKISKYYYYYILYRTIFHILISKFFLKPTATEYNKEIHTNILYYNI